MGEKCLGNILRVVSGCYEVFGEFEVVIVVGVFGFCWEVMKFFFFISYRYMVGLDVYI